MLGGGAREGRRDGETRVFDFDPEFALADVSSDEGVYGLPDPLDETLGSTGACWHPSNPSSWMAS